MVRSGGGEGYLGKGRVARTLLGRKRRGSWSGRVEFDLEARKGRLNHKARGCQTTRAQQGSEEGTERSTYNHGALDANPLDDSDGVLKLRLRVHLVSPDVVVVDEVVEVLDLARRRGWSAACLTNPREELDTTYLFALSLKIYLLRRSDELGDALRAEQSARSP